MIWAVVPAYNEAENLQVLVPRIVDVLRAMDGGGSVCVVDDGSTDGTAQVLENLGEKFPEVTYLRQRHNMGKAAALRRGFHEAGEADVVVMMDADGQDDPHELPRLVARLDSADLVTGARLERRDRFVKRHTSRLYNGVTRRLARTPGRDFNSGYKVMRAEVARAVAPMLYGEMHRYLTVIAHNTGYRVAEEPVEHHERMSGTSKYGLARFWRGFADLVTVRFLLTYEHRPSHLFGGVGLVSLLAGVVTLAYLLVAKISGEAIGDRPLLIAGVLMTMAGLQLTLFGLLAELVVHARNLGRPRGE